MTVDQWVAIFSSLGTVLAAVIAAVSVVELRRQNQLQYRPVLTIEEAYIDVEVGQDSVSWKVANSDDADGSTQSRPRVAVINVGNGVAVHVQCEWHYNVDLLVEKVDRVLSANGSPISINVDRSWVSITAPNGPNSFTRAPGSHKLPLDYVAPVTANAGKRSIPIDFLIQQLISLFYSTLFNASRKRGEALSLDLPIDLRLNTAFQNSINHSFVESIPINIELISWQVAGDKTPAKAKFKIATRAT